MTDDGMLNVCFANAGKRIAFDILTSGTKEVCVWETSNADHRSAEFVLIESLNSELRKSSAHVFFAKDKEDTQRTVLSYLIIEKVVNARKKEHFFAEPTVERLAKIKISYRLIEPKTGEILLAKEIEESLHNTISEKAYLALKTVTLKKGMSFKSFLEPAIVTAIIGGLMYLFYSHKSSQ